MNVRLSILIILLTISFFGCSMNLSNSAKLYEKKGDCNMAIRYYEKAVRLESRQIERVVIYMQLSSLYSRAGQFDIAQTRLESALTIISDLPEEAIRQVLPEADVDYCLALNALKKGNYKRCINLLENMKTDDAPDIHYYLSIAYKGQAEEYFRGIPVGMSLPKPTTSVEFRDAINLINKGRELASSGSFEEAKEKFRLALEQVPENGLAQNDYEKALLLLKNKEYAEAAHLLLEMGETADVNYYMSLAYQEQAHISAQKAIQWLEAEKEKETREGVSVLYEDAIKTIER